MLSTAVRITLTYSYGLYRFSARDCREHTALPKTKPPVVDRHDVSALIRRVNDLLDGIKYRIMMLQEWSKWKSG